MIKRPAMRYPGGKFLLAQRHIQHFPHHKLFVETHVGGSLGILLYKTRSEGEVINDIYDEVVDVFKVLRDPEKAKKLARLLELTPHSYTEYLRAYDVDEGDDDVERARKMIYRSFASIGSDGASRRHAGFRTLKNNESYVTSAKEWARFPRAISSFTDRLRGVVIENRDALRIIEIYDRPLTFFYVDPPYLKAVRARHSVHYKHEYTDEDHIKLSEALLNIKGMAIICGYKGKLYKKLYEGNGWKRFDYTAKYQNGASAGASRVDSIWASPNIETTLF